jgi:hypothetical protein
MRITAVIAHQNQLFQSMRHYLPEITILGCEEDPLFTFLLSETFGLVVFNDPFDGFTNKARAASDENYRRHDLMKEKIR